MMHRTRCGFKFGVGDGRAPLRGAAVGAVAVTDRGAGVTPGRGTLIDISSNRHSTTLCSRKGSSY